MSFKARLPEWVFKRRKRVTVPESVEIELKMTDAIGRVVCYSGCWEWDTKVKQGLTMTTGRTGDDLSGGSATVTIRPPNRESYNRRH